MTTLQRMMRAADYLIAAGAALRLTRLVTTDELGEWTIRAPARLWVYAHEGHNPETGYVDASRGWRSKLVSGLDCPHCVAFHASWICLASLALAPRVARPVATALALSYPLGHISHHADV